MRRILYLFLLFAATNLLGVVARAQQRTVSGTILAEDDNSPLQGVTVTNQNTSKRVQTNSAGYYSIAAEKGHVLIFTFVGFVRKEIVLGDEKMISPKLTPSDQQIGEVVVTAYGIKREKKSLGSDVQEIKGEDIAQTRRDNFINSLAGRVPGASVVSTSGAPGSSTSIILRGGTSLGLTNQPLFVIDGVPLDNNVVNQDRDGLQTRSTANRSDDFTNRAADINPEDIESLTILKGPEAQALYGSDGANGAIIITTKKGKIGKASVTYDNSLRLENLYRYHETQRVYARGRNGIANLNETNSAFGEAAALSPFFFGPKFAPGTTFYDNLNDFFRTGTTQQHNLSVEGGNDGFTYRFNTGYSNQKGVIPSSGFNRLSVRFSGTAKLSPKSNLLITANFINSNVDKTTKGIGGYYMTTLTWPGDNDMRTYLNPNNTRKLLFSSGTTNSTEYDNPYWDVNKNEAEDRTNRIMGNVTYNYNPSKVIGFTSIVSVDNYTTQGYQVTNPTSRYGVGTNGYYSQFDLIFRQLTGNFRTTIKKTFGEFRNTLSMGFYVEDNRRVVNSFKGERFFEPNIASINNTEPITRVPVNSIQETRKIRFYGQYQLNWKDILIPTFSFAHEGTSVLMSRFENKDPFYSYGSGSLAFNISEIPSFKNKFRKIDLLKFRTSYSTSGQTAGLLPYNIDPTFQAVTTTGGGYAYGFTGNNFKLQPQFTKSFEYGLEGSFFKKRLGINLSVYKNK
jgi:TonB-linked SusC/RagA family outer membrane protein